MSKEKKSSAAALPLVRELFQLGIYKRSQGRVTRQVTFGASWLLIAVGAWRLGDILQKAPGSGSDVGGGLPVSVVVPVAVGLIGGWIAYRLVNLPSFADFLIAVEAEMNKVSWPTRSELIRSSIVVIFSILFLAAVLYFYDSFWAFLLSRLGVMRH
ncbi:MAG TPA: preprotein translocase subunit SecE [Pirellulales bacterium]|nr:preprotein translocase subunit SecE [Pirellulales bacterium]